MNKKGFTLMEIIVAVFISVLVIANLAYILLAGRRHILRSRSKIQAAELGRFFLDPLQMDVRQDTWDRAVNGLSTTPPVTGRNCTQQPGCPNLPNERTLDGILYNPTYYIDRVDPTDLRRVRVEINWDEPSS